MASPTTEDAAAVTVLVAGARASGSGYPNAANTIRILRDSDFRVVDRGIELPPSLHLWRLRYDGPIKAALRLAWIVALNACTLLKVLAAGGARGAPVYVPYPAVFFLWLVACIPVRWRPWCIADAYISIWDATFRDRAANGGHGRASRLVQRCEARALKAARIVLVDTEANRSLLVRDLGIDPECIRSIPLAIESPTFLRIGPYVPRVPASSIRVLFVGTLIPLHGIDVVLDAVRNLAGDPRFEFRLVGDGQLGGQVEALLRDHPARIVWVREWCSIDRLADEIAAADICLGIFGGGAKASRVLPFKLYMYLAAGRAAISQAAVSMPAGAPFPPFVPVDPTEPGGLAAAIRTLAADPVHRQKLAGQARAYYQSWLSDRAIASSWRALFLRDVPPG